MVDEVDQPLGFRYFSVDANNGFYLNGKYLDLHGVNRHQDRLNKGWAIGTAEHLEDFNLIKEMGANTMRLAHYQHAEYFYQLCDSNGMVIWAEFPFVNNVTVSTAFYDNAKQQLTELIRQNYNHPSLFFWGIGNELSCSPDPNPLLTQLNDLAHSEDSTRLTTYASNVTECSQSWHTDVSAFNRYDGWYSNSYNDFPTWADTTHANHPSSKLGVSEYGAGASINIHTITPKAQDHSEEYQCLFHEAYWREMQKRPFLWGKFIWNMFDFAADGRNEGDTPGRNDKGMVTYDRKTKKDVFFYYQANWSTTPVVYITDRRFTNRTIALTNVKIYSNCDSVELKINGVSQGSKTGTVDKVFQWTNITLASGSNTIQAIGTKGSSQYTDSGTWNFGASATPTPGPGNLVSKDKTASASSIQTGNTQQNGNDGNMTTRWSASSGTYPQWWKVDLGTGYNLNAVAINWYNSSSRYYKYRIEASNDDKSYTTQVDKTGNTVYGDTSDNLNVSARYVRITVTGCSSGTAYASFYECNVYSGSGNTPTPTVKPTVTPTSTVPPTSTPTPTAKPSTPTPTPVSSPTPTSTPIGSPVLLSQGKVASASTSQANNSASAGNDGNISTRWSASSSSYPQWWKVDLGTGSNLAKVDINWYSSSSRAYKYKIEVSSDDTTYTTKVDKTGNAVFGDTSDSFITTARYVRVTVTGCSSGSGYASASEIKVYGN